jgi:hypothetical protein
MLIKEYNIRVILLLNLFNSFNIFNIEPTLIQYHLYIMHMFIFQILYMGIASYAPSTALEAGNVYILVTNI